MDWANGRIGGDVGTRKREEEGGGEETATVRAEDEMTEDAAKTKRNEQRPAKQTKKNEQNRSIPEILDYALCKVMMIGYVFYISDSKN